VNQVAKVADHDIAAVTPEADSKSSFQLLMNSTSFAAVQTIADNLATSSAGKRFQKGDCFVITLDALSSGLDPFKVASEAHITQGGQVGYSSKVVNAIVITRAPIRKRPEFEYFGSWERILGKVQERKSENGKGKYYVSDWKEADEQGLGVRVRMHFKNEDQPREMEVLLTQCWPRFSTQWATDPRQQIAYAAVRKMARLHTPDVLLGIFAAEELEGDEGIAPAPRDMGAAEVVTDSATSKSLTDAELKTWMAAARKGSAAASEHWRQMGPDLRRRATDAQKLKVREAADKADRERTVDAGAAGVETSTAATSASTEAAPPADQPPAAAEPIDAESSESTDKASDNGTADFVADMDRADAAAAAAKSKGSK